MRIKPLAWVLVLLLSPAWAQDREGNTAAKPESEEATKLEDAVSSDAKDAASDPAKRPADFQPSEEIMADTMLTLPADI